MLRPESCQAIAFASFCQSFFDELARSKSAFLEHLSKTTLAQ
jgi:hypothetical protein